MSRRSDIRWRRGYRGSPPRLRRGLRTVLRGFCSCCAVSCSRSSRALRGLSGSFLFSFFQSIAHFRRKINRAAKISAEKHKNAFSAKCAVVLPPRSTSFSGAEQNIARRVTGFFFLRQEEKIASCKPNVNFCVLIRIIFYDIVKIPRR